MWGLLENYNLNNNMEIKYLSIPIVTIGRSLKNSILIDDKSISNFHCKIEYKKE